MNRKRLLGSVAFVGGIAVAGTTLTGFRGVDTDLGVYDANNRYVGQPHATDAMYKQYNDGIWYFEGWTPPFTNVNGFHSNGGLVRDMLFLHKSLNCGDAHPYDWYYGDEFVGPPIARFDGTNVWASTPGTETQIAVQSFWYAGENSVGGQAACYNYSYTAWATVPKLVGTPVYTAPFAVR